MEDQVQGAAVAGGGGERVVGLAAVQVVFPKLGITSRAELRDALEALHPEPSATRP